jgi:hypothetical protein
VGEILDQFRTRAIRGFQITGSPTEVADEIEAIVDGSGIDGIMLEPTFGGPDAYRAFIELVVPLLRERGRLDPLMDAVATATRTAGGGAAGDAAPRVAATGDAADTGRSARDSPVPNSSPAAGTTPRTLRERVHPGGGPRLPPTHRAHGLTARSGDSIPSP